MIYHSDGIYTMIDEGRYILNLHIPQRLIERLQNAYGPIETEDELEDAMQEIIHDDGLVALHSKYS